MGDPAKEIENDSVSMDGLEDVFNTKDTPVLRCEDTEDNPTLSRETTQDTPVLSVEEVTEDWTVKEAADVFNCSEKTVLRKLRSGKLAGYKVQGEKTLEWRVKRDTKDNTVTPIETRQDKSVQDTDKNGILLEEMRGKLEQLEGQLQAAIYRNGYLEGKLEDREKQVLLLPDLQARAHQVEVKEQEINSLKAELDMYKGLIERSTWRKFWDWMLGKNV